MNFDVGADRQLCLPVREGWTAAHDPASKAIVLRSAKWVVIFKYDRYDANGGTLPFFRRAHATGPKYNHRLRAGTALMNIAEGFYS